MWYWNQQNFEGLIAVADSIADQQQWSLFAQFCRLREQGLRPQALQAITELIAEASGWDDNARNRFADWTILAGTAQMTLRPISTLWVCRFD